MMPSATEFSSQCVGRLCRDLATSPVMVELPASEFVMGENKDDKFANDTERPAHLVCIRGGLSLGRCPVTVGEFRHFRSEKAPHDDDSLPVVGVSWHDATAYCAWLSNMTGGEYRLPSEAEWEFACRAGSDRLFAFGDHISPAVANFLYDEHGRRIGAGRPLAVGSYLPNAFGLQDLHENVCEWVEDTWHSNYVGAPADGRAWVDLDNPCRVVRGGAWDYMPRLLRSAWRDWRPADQRSDNVGFRVATHRQSGLTHLVGG